MIWDVWPFRNDRPLFGYDPRFRENHTCCGCKVSGLRVSAMHAMPTHNSKLSKSGPSGKGLECIRRFYLTVSTLDCQHFLQHTQKSGLPSSNLKLSHFHRGKHFVFELSCFLLMRHLQPLTLHISFKYSSLILTIATFLSAGVVGLLMGWKFLP